MAVFFNHYYSSINSNRFKYLKNVWQFPRRPKTPNATRPNSSPASNRTINASDSYKNVINTKFSKIAQHLDRAQTGTRADIFEGFFDVFCLRWDSLRGRLGAFLFLGGSGQHGDELLGVNEALIVDLHLVVSLVDLVGGELVAPGHEGVAQPLAVDLSFLVEGLEGVDDDVVLVGATGHPGGEEGQQLGEVDWAWGLVDHLVEFLVDGEASQGVEGGAKVVLADDAVLVVVH